MIMSDVITQLFVQNVTSAVQDSVTSKRPLFVYATTGKDMMAQKFLVSNGKPNDLVLGTLSQNFVCLKIQAGLAEFKQFQEVYKAALAPSFTIFVDGTPSGQIKESQSPELFAKLIEKHVPGSSLLSLACLTPTSVEKHKSEFARKKKEEARERERLRALIAADRRETRMSSGVEKREKKVKNQSAGRNEKFVLSVRLLDGEMVKGEFEGTSTLMDVKRWIENEKNVILTLSENGLSGIMTRPGFPEPSHIAFYAPGTNVTYTEPQELCRLRDLDLFPRLALILKAEYDEEILNAPTKVSMWRLVGGKMSTMLLALYVFFDYGLDDAQRDYQAMNASEVGEEEISHFALLTLDATLPASPEEPEKDDKKEKKEMLQEMDYSLVGLTRLGTPAPSGTSRINVGGSDPETEELT